MAAPWLSKDVISILVSHVNDLKTAYALCLTNKAFNEAVKSQTRLEVLACGRRLVDFKPLKKGDWTVKETMKQLNGPEWSKEQYNMQIFTFAIFGQKGSGKTASAVHYCKNHFVEDCDPTIDESYRKKVTLGGRDLIVEMWDCDSDKKVFFAAPKATDQWSDGEVLRRNFAFVVLYNLTNRESFEEAKEILRFAEEHLEERDMWNCILVGNKVDLAEELRAVSIAEGRKLAQKHQIAFCEASAKTKENLKEWMEYFVINQVRRNLKGLGHGQNGPVEKKNQKEKCILQ